MKERQSNFELLRIVAMLMVMVIHATAYGPVGMPTVADGVNHPLSAFARCLTHGMVIVCVNVFVLISGYFGIRLKAKSIASYLFQTAFWRFFCLALICAIYGVGVKGIKACSWIPFASMTIKPLGFTFGAWFIGAYLGLMLLSPVLNAFIEQTDTRSLGKYVIGFFAVEMVFDWLISGLSFFRGGFTLVPLIGLYLCGAWLRRSDCVFARWNFNLFATVYFAIATLSASAMFFALLMGRKLPIVAGIAGNLFFPFSSAHAILGSVAFFLMFSRLKFNSKIVNWTASSAFAAYLFHGAMPFYKATALRLFEDSSGPIYLLELLGFIAIVFISVVLVDKIRMFIWNCISKKILK